MKQQRNTISPLLFGMLAAVTLYSQAGLAAPQVSDPQSYKLGSISSWSEAINVGIKELALSSPATPAEMDAIVSAAAEIAAGYGVSVYREPELIVTDLFPASVAEGKDVLLLYRGSTLDRYLALKKRQASLVKTGQYEGVAREEIAREFGRLLSYPESVIDQKLLGNGVKLAGTRAFDGVWKSPTISLDDERWLIPDAACRNGCSELSYEYMHDLLNDPENDEVSVVDLYRDTQEFNRQYIASLTRPSTLDKWRDYDAANDAALDCTPEGDGLQHQIAAPPAIKFEHRGDNIVIRYEYWNAVRNIYMDGRAVPDDVEATRLGYSVGRFEDDALHVRTYHLTPSQINLMGNKFFMSSDAEFYEKYQLSDDGERMDVWWSVFDPINLRGPYTGRMTWLAAPGWELDKWSCEAITGEY
ncbi:MAG: hypothetical protein KJO31_08875 [Gammaproteobacteria bacterium]|nr:hypothetical protein [Gammaproteobacteria bacterium]